MSEQFDAIVVGSGITGGWAAKELTERGLSVLLIERGPMLEHQTDYKTEMLAPWELQYRGHGDPKLFDEDYAIQSKGMSFNEWTYTHFANDRENPYQTTEKDPFQWRRGYQLGGKSLLWGRQCYRWSDVDFGANAADGHGCDWPIRYSDVSPWYDHVEQFIGVSGSKEGLPQLPDGHFQPPMAMNAVELALKAKMNEAYSDRKLVIGRSSNMTEAKGDRSPCQYRNICARGCSFGAYFSTQSSTLPAARATERLTLITDSLVDSLDYDVATKRITGVRVLDTKTKSRKTYTAKAVFLCAGTINSVSVLLRSASDAQPNGLANSSGTLGHYLMDHALTMSVVAEVPGFLDHGYFGNRPNGIVIPRFYNLDNRESELLRGYSYQGGAYRRGWARGAAMEGVGKAFKEKLHGPGEWNMLLGAFAECLPRADNRITLDRAKVDAFGIAQTRIDFSYGANERRLLEKAGREAKEMVALLGAQVLSYSEEPGLGGTAVHEMGGARMGKDPTTSVLNAHNQAHDVANLFVTDGAAMASSACQNPSLTYMALTARAAAYAAERIKQNAL
ncbi:MULTISPECIES: FAD-dependent oxidoreductase [unclassified Sphingomonas]|uniref:FAD-dependent oxidoreductase n=1 Tax=unclassified Sphingomonas TaxID=196159 RepID=UPI0006F7DB17|nr:MULTISPECIES: GMC family oxidoreductase [unclassified Sphingomonas]KQX25011.1 GMC family oxidoreductase [Sphingomonas sp. Root1294]KQY66028.1 GMC family oxidoreductase [Sphingomonas sp. Root50]KRB89807.1 GMC family oxidoreductase [Sphingomonas sp. Root720]